ncbi:YheC/YheD family protein [Polaromonas sp.]|uniref:YheC/YheD family protein n=1 Tax=Polaromonas sp. TaxID=1869339 RepID=UPI003752A96F
MLASDKLAFKRQASAMGLRVPAGWKGAEPLAENFLVKKCSGSFGLNIEGPFDARAWDYVQAMAQGSYCEQFVTGRSAKAWCWNREVVALELVESPYLVGDGVRSLEALAARRGNVGQALPLDKAAAMLAWQGLTSASIPEVGQKVLLDFKYATPFDAPVFENRNVWSTQEEAIRHQFAKAASLLGKCMPAQLHGRQMFTLDAVVDEQGRVWFLEMNSHPMIHPDVYSSMLETLTRGA